MNQSNFTNWLTPEAVRRFGLDNPDVYLAVVNCIRLKKLLKKSYDPVTQLQYESALEKVHEMRARHKLPDLRRQS